MDKSLIFILLVPILGYTGYLLQIWSEIYRLKKYGKHIVISQDALFGPLAPAIVSKKWINIPMLLTWLGIEAVLLLGYYYQDILAQQLHPDIFEGALGFYFTAVVLAIVFSLWPLLTYSYALKEPTTLTGQTIIDARLTSHQALYQVCAITYLLLCLTSYQPTPFLWGSVIVTACMAFNLWRRSRS